MKKSYIFITILLLGLGIASSILFDIMQLKIVSDASTNRLLSGIVSRFIMAGLFIWLSFVFRGTRLLAFNKSFFNYFSWILPCLMVAFINFPFSALIQGTASITRMDLIGLYALYVFSIALLEEFIFRGILLLILDDYLRGRKHKPFFMALISSLVFSLFHLTNLIVGADVAGTLLQCLYTFLIGGMLAVTMLKTKNIWLCILIHTIFDFGGLLIANIGIGNPWDTIFWILTITGGLLCAGHIIFSLIKLEKEYVSE